MAVQYFGEMMQALLTFVHKFFYGHKTLYCNSELFDFTWMVLYKCYSFYNIILMFGTTIMKLFVSQTHAKWVIIYKSNRVSPFIFFEISCISEYSTLFDSLWIPKLKINKWAHVCLCVCAHTNSCYIDRLMTLLGL